MNHSDSNSYFDHVTSFQIARVIQKTAYLQLYQKETKFTLLNCKVMMNNINNFRLFKTEIITLNIFIDFCLKMINPITEDEKYKQSILLGKVTNFNENLFDDRYFFNLYIECQGTI